MRKNLFLAPDFPFSPARFPFFYGWLIAVLATLSVLMSIPGQTIGVSVFTDPLLLATGLSRVELSNAYMVGTLCSGLLLPYAGGVLDRVGARVTIVGASLLLGLTLVYLSRVDQLALSAASTLGLQSGPVAIVLLILGFFSLRFSGQGMLTLIGRTLIGRWFDRFRGRVVALQGPFISLGFSAAPSALGAWVAMAGWRGAWVGLAITVSVVMSVLGWLFFRDTPEECGLRMDGAPEAQNRTGEAAKQERNFSREEAAKTAAFWIFTAGLAAQGLNITGVTFHIVDIGAQSGLTAAKTVSLFPWMAGVSILSNIGVGALIDRIQPRWVLLGMMITQAMGILCAGQLGSDLGWVGTILGLGISGGCFAPLSTAVFPRFFGRAHLGRINSLMLMVVVWGSALGPSAMALSRQYQGSYSPALYICALLPVIVGLLGGILGIGKRP